MLHLKLLDEEEQAKPQTSRQKKKGQNEQNRDQKKKKYKESMNQKKKLNKNDKPLVNLTKMRREKTQINKI
jgi:hypothetical protein